MNFIFERKYLGTWSFYKRALSIALPVMAQLLVQNLVSLVDNFMVAGLGDIKMAGVNVVGYINFLFIILVSVITASGGIFMSQFLGAKDKEGMEQTFRFKILLTGIAGILYTILCWTAPKQLFAVILTTNSDASIILEQSISYSRSVALSWFFMVFSQSIASSLREIEIVKPPLIISIIATFINTFFNWIFIYGNLGSPRLEVIGAGYATVIARAAELLLFIIYIAVKKPLFLFKISNLFKINFRFFITIIKKSSMILYSEMLWAVSETISSALLNTRGGAEVVSGIVGGFSIANLFFICFSGIITVSGVMIGQELGAGRLEEAKKMKNWIISGSMIFGTLFSVLGLSTIFIIPIVFKNLTPEAQSIAKGLVITAIGYLPLWACLNAQYAISRTGGDTNLGVIADTVANILFVGGLFLLCAFTALGPIAIFAIVKLSDISKILIAYFWLKKERWVVNLASIPK